MRYRQGEISSYNMDLFDFMIALYYVKSIKFKHYSCHMSHFNNCSVSILRPALKIIHIGHWMQLLSSQHLPIIQN